MTILKRKKISFFASENDKAARVIRAEYHGPGGAPGRPKPVLELPGRFYDSISDGDLYYQPDVRRVGYTGRGFQPRSRSRSTLRSVILVLTHDSTHNQRTVTEPNYRL